MLFRSVGLEWESLLGKGGWNGVPLVDAAANFKRPCRFGDTVEIESWVEEWRGKTSWSVTTSRTRASLRSRDASRGRGW